MTLFRSLSKKNTPKIDDASFYSYIACFFLGLLSASKKFLPHNAYVMLCVFVSKLCKVKLFTLSSRPRCEKVPTLTIFLALKNEAVAWSFLPLLGLCFCLILVTDKVSWSFMIILACVHGIKLSIFFSMNTNSVFAQNLSHFWTTIFSTQALFPLSWCKPLSQATYIFLLNRRKYG